MGFDLTTAAGLEAYLAETKFAAADIQTLTGGHGGFTYRVMLKTPLETGATSVVVKHTFKHLISDKNMLLSQERMKFEHKAIMMINESGLCTLESTVQVPQVLHYDSETYTLIMTDLAPARTLSTVLIESLQRDDPEHFRDLSSQIGAAIGDFMGRFHKWGSLPAQSELRAQFLENKTSREAVLRIRYQLMLMTAEKFGMKEGWMDEMAADGMRDAQHGGSVIAMADFWFDNILVSDGPLRIYIIDWEMARCARPELDVAHFATAAHSLVHVHPTAAGRFELMPSFVRGYNAHYELDEVQVGLSGGRDVMSFGVMMPWVRHREERVKEEIASAGLELLEAARNKDVEGIRTSVVVRDMYPGN